MCPNEAIPNATTAVWSERLAGPSPRRVIQTCSAEARPPNDPPARRGRSTLRHRPSIGRTFRVGFVLFSRQAGQGRRRRRRLGIGHLARGSVDSWQGAVPPARDRTASGRADRAWEHAPRAAPDVAATHAPDGSELAVRRDRAFPSPAESAAGRQRQLPVPGVRLPGTALVDAGRRRGNSAGDLAGSSSGTIAASSEAPAHRMATVPRRPGYRRRSGLLAAASMTFTSVGSSSRCTIISGVRPFAFGKRTSAP
jgi:hypothetical protein